MTASTIGLFPRNSAVRLVLVLLVVLVGISRFACIPGQPWEQDEALFAAAAFDTNLAEHRPHPPGFPLWVAAAKISAWALGDPLLGLQLLSAATSTALAVFLALLWGRLLGPWLGVAAAGVFSFLPGVWFHAPRAFSTTPALAAAALAGVLWLSSGAGAGLFAWAALAVSVLIRPVLAPPICVFAAAAMVLRREARRRIALGAGLCLVVIAAGFLPLVIDSGGPAGYLAALASHGSEHADGLWQLPWAPAGLGIVKAVGGVIPAVIALAAGLIGWLEIRRRDRRVAWAWVLVTVVTAAWIVLAHNRAYPRYTLPWLALWVGPVAAGLARLGRSDRAGAAAAGVLAAASALWTAPAVAVQARGTPPPLAAMAAAQGAPGARAVIVEGGMSPFLDLSVLSLRGATPLYWRTALADGRVPASAVPGPWRYVWAEGSVPRWIPGPRPAAGEWSTTNRRLRSLSQGRYLSAWVADRGALILEPAEARPGRSRGLEVRAPVTLLAQPAPRGSWLGLVADIEGAPAGLTLEVSGERPRTATVSVGEHTVHLPLGDRPRKACGRATIIRLARTAPETPARIVLRRVWLDSPDGRGAPGIVPAEAFAGGLHGLVSGDGFFGLERLGVPARPGRWARSEASLSVPAAPGMLRIELCAPRPGPARVVVRTGEGGGRIEAAIGPAWQTVDLPAPDHTGRVVIHIETANPFVPAAADPTSSDTRRLGVVVGAVHLLPG